MMAAPTPMPTAAPTPLPRPRPPQPRPRPRCAKAGETLPATKAPVVATMPNAYMPSRAPVANTRVTRCRTEVPVAEVLILPPFFVIPKDDAHRRKSGSIQTKLQAMRRGVHAHLRDARVDPCIPRSRTDRHATTTPGRLSSPVQDR